jgi:hypothetical protein
MWNSLCRDGDATHAVSASDVEDNKFTVFAAGGRMHALEMILAGSHFSPPRTILVVLADYA